MGEECDVQEKCGVQGEECGVHGEECGVHGEEWGVHMVAYDVSREECGKLEEVCII